MYEPPPYVLAPYDATPFDVVDRMLSFADVRPFDMVFDLGCGDGRVVIRAATARGARGFGVDIEPYWVEQSRFNAWASQVSHLVRFEQGDALAVDLSSASVVFLYLLHWSTQFVANHIFQRVPPGTRVISHGFPIESLPPSATETFIDASGIWRTIGVWRA
jgi:SAM-dependent methyltransferase